MTAKRHNKEEILELYKGCQEKLGEPPGIERFCKMAKLRKSEVKYYWPTPAALRKEVGAVPNKFGSKLSDEVVFQDYARVCLHLQKIPTDAELRITQRELGTKTHTAHSRHGNIKAFQERFREWLENSPDELRIILRFEGWSRPKIEKSSEVSRASSRVPLQLHPFLPSSLQYLDVLAHGEMPSYESSDLNVSTLFERRTADAFRSLGFEMRSLGQGTGRTPDAIALAAKERFAILIDAKVRANGIPWALKIENS